MGFLAPVIPIVASIIGAGSSVAGGVMGANASSAAGEQSERQGRYNAHLANVAAADAEARGATQAGAARSQASRVVGAQQAAFGASGVDVGTGTPQALASATRTMGELDALTARNNAAREAWGFKRQASQFLQAGAQAKAAAQAQATGSLLTGFGQAAGYLGQAARGYSEAK